MPGKNLRTVGGVPLLVRAISAARAAERIDAVYVSTDDAEIAGIARRAGAGVIERPATISGDHASSESALLHAIDQLTVAGQHLEILVFLQCTSPFIDPHDLDRAVERIACGQADTAFSAVESYEFVWRDADPALEPGAGMVLGQNHDAAVRPRRQDRRPDFRESGAFYAMTTVGFLRHRHRFFGRISVVTVPELTAVEIDTPDDLVLAESLARTLEAVRSGAGVGPLSEIDAVLDVDAVITDFDGVHTCDTAYLDETGQESVRVSRSDGLGIGRLRAAGIPMLILSKERNRVVTARARKLGVEARQGVDAKAPALLAWLAEHHISPQRAVYVGNDVNDLAPMAEVGWPVAVADARPEVLAAARLVLSREGGRGAVRELCDLVVAASNQPTPTQDSLTQHAVASQHAARPSAPDDGHPAGRATSRAEAGASAAVEPRLRAGLPG